jgi:hypothetical protein
MPRREIALKVEHFYHDEDLDFRISSRKEMCSILKGIANQGTQVALFYGHSQKFVFTILLDVTEHGMWLDIGPYPPENKQLILSNKITFVGVHQHVKIQFTTHHIESDSFENESAFYMDMPGYMLRIQRREHFRIAVPATSPVRCIIPIQPEDPEEPLEPEAAGDPPSVTVGVTKVNWPLPACPSVTADRLDVESVSPRPATKTDKASPGTAGEALLTSVPLEWKTWAGPDPLPAMVKIPGAADTTLSDAAELVWPLTPTTTFTVVPA